MGEYTQSRIRVNEEGASETLGALREREWNLVLMRQKLGDQRSVSNINRRLKAVRRVIAETEATILEMGWVYTEVNGDELLGSIEEGAGSPAPAAGGLGRRT